MNRIEIILLIIIPFCEIANAQAPNWLWADGAGGSNFDIDTGSGIAVDGSGNSYITGHFGTGSIEFDPYYLSNNGSFDIFIAKYTSSGNVVWAQSAGGNASEAGHSVALDAYGNCYATGYFGSSTITFGSITLTNNGSNNIFIVKYDPSGNVLWAKNSVGTGDDGGALGIAADGLGNCYVTGYFSSNSVTFGSFTLTNGGVDNIFVVKYDPLGNVLWARRAGGSSSDWGHAIAADATGNSYLTGHFSSNSIIFGTDTLTNSSGNHLFVVKYDAPGNVVWARSTQGGLYDEGNGIAADDSGNCYVSGDFNGDSTTFGAITLTSDSSADIFVVKFDTSGTVVWAKRAGGNSTEYGTGIAMDGSSNIYVTGYFASDIITFDSSSLTNYGSTNIFVAKYDLAGTVIWAKSATGSFGDRCFGIAADGDGNSYVTGDFSNGITFGSTTLTNNSFADIFIAKLSGLATGIEEMQTDKETLQIFPNPFSSQTVLQSTGVLHNASLIIEDIFGQRIKEANNLNGQRFILQREGLPCGIYFILLTEESKIIAVKKLIITG